MTPLKMLEFYSGIGGMHYAATLADWDFEVVKAFDINNVANDIYKHNFGPKTVGQRQIEALTLEYYDKVAADIWTMSPPCQPYSRLGLQKGSQDARSRSFLHLLQVLEGMKNRPKYILVENVKGFEESDSRDLLVDSLNRCNYTFQEFLLTPLQLGIPNSRMRYYLLAKQKPLSFVQPPTNTILGFIPKSTHMSTEFIDNRTRTLDNEDALVALSAVQIGSVSRYLEPEATVNFDSHAIPDKTLLKHGHVFDIVKPSTHRSCCFTKGYYHYAEATGSILQMNEDLLTAETFDKAAEAKNKGNEQEALELLRSLRLRYFTPREVANLMGFPDTFTFPDSSTIKQRYRTLGNSINVRLVSELMSYLMKTPNKS
ncbi:cytosine(38)-C(5)-methyltransferase-like protein [Zychaea mexicana]|uniref:cytosine(38)-C(5)-methyltransferase-like protein n=1 Tax=Zychaea mexicana TaxID=64656 RepID=UPI0022FDD861|nr:cytosine(38)-C(5)-methyltransferase-like protein [Zychaea mexicana]KAI9495155.1 cytosine(38)-C(5)-methyltransferase-like protein [Zychaea mexicana]